MKKLELSDYQANILNQIILRVLEESDYYAIEIGKNGIAALVGIQLDLIKILR
jgi:hypothetical protein